ncbi:MAG: hypothetical protein WB566_05665 [Terriglobales bacterium]
MSLLDDNIAELQQRDYLVEHWGAYLFAAGYSDLTITAEETLELGGRIMRRAAPLVRALGKPIIEHEDYIAVIEAMSDAEKVDLRAGINFTQRNYPFALLNLDKGPR